MKTKGGWGWRIAAIVAVILIGAAGAAYAFRDRLAMAAMPRQAAQLLAADRIADLPEGLHVGLCGTGSPFPDPNRSGPCTAVIAGKRLFIVDSGEGASETLARMNLGLQHAEAVLLTHFHSDHIDGLGALALQRWAGTAAQAPLTLYGAEGVERVAAGFNEAYALDRRYRIAHHGEATVPPGGFGLTPQVITFPPGADSVVVLEADGLKITAFKVDHSPVEPALGYRFEYAGRSVVISGDTKKHPGVVTAARGADLLVHEALSAEMVAVLSAAAQEAGRANLAKAFADIPDYHTTPVEAAETAAEAGVRALVLTHIVPAMPTRALEPAFLRGTKAAFSGRLWLGRDGDLYSLPAGSTAITHRNVLR